VPKEKSYDPFKTIPDLINEIIDDLRKSCTGKRSKHNAWILANSFEWLLI
jgi:hypothetical protein